MSVVGSPADGYVVKGPLVAEPKTVKVRGPQSDVMVLQHVRADAFDVRTITAEGQYPRQLAIEKPSPRLKIEPQSVIVTAEITREVAERVFQKLPVAVVGPAKGKTQPAGGRRSARVPAGHRPQPQARADRPAGRGHVEGAVRQRVAAGGGPHRQVRCVHRRRARSWRAGVLLDAVGAGPARYTADM